MSVFEEYCVFNCEIYFSIRVYFINSLFQNCISLIVLNGKNKKAFMFVFYAVSVVMSYVTFSQELLIYITVRMH